MLGASNLLRHASLLIIGLIPNARIHFSFCHYPVWHYYLFWLQDIICSFSLINNVYHCYAMLFLFELRQSLHTFFTFHFTHTLSTFIKKTFSILSQPLAYLITIWYLGFTKSTALCSSVTCFKSVLRSCVI